MSFTFRPARRSEAKPLVGIFSESGCGKTWSALMLARGFVGPNGKIGMIETESGRGEVYADVLPGGYAVLPLREDFSPATYGEAISAAESSGIDALVIDSASHEWEGLGGVLDMAAKNDAAGKKGPLVWQKPKIDHAKHFMLRLMQTPIKIVIVCMRAKYPMEQITQATVQAWRDAGEFGKPPKLGEWMRSRDLVPKQSEDILYEMLVHGWIDSEHRFNVTKYTRDDLRQVIRNGEPISIATGEAFALWAAGGTAAKASTPATSTQPSVSLEEVTRVVAMAKTLAELDAVKRKAALLSDADKDAARELFRKRRDELTPKETRTPGADG